jgi:hypothetical protein
MKKILMLVLFLAATQVFGSTLSLTCAVGGVTLERYNDSTYGWVAAGTLPRTFTVPQNTLVQIRANAPGYKEYATAICVNTAGTKTFNVVLEPDGVPNTIPLFAIGGTVTSRGGTYIAAGDFIVKTVNLTRYRTPDGAGQGGTG